MRQIDGKTQTDGETLICCYWNKFALNKSMLNTYSMRQPDLYYFETNKNDVTNHVKFCMANTSDRRVFFMNFD